MRVPSRLLLAVIIYAVLMTVLLVTRPAIMFDMNSRPKHWGAQISERVSIFAPAFAFPLLGLFSYYLAAVVELAGGLKVSTAGG